MSTPVATDEYPLSYSTYHTSKTSNADFQKYRYRKKKKYTEIWHGFYNLFLTSFLLFLMNYSFLGEIETDNDTVSNSEIKTFGFSQILANCIKLTQNLHVRTDEQTSDTHFRTSWRKLYTAFAYLTYRGYNKPTGRSFKHSLHSHISMFERYKPRLDCNVCTSAVA